ncbi:hypothetical protein Tco_0773393 [Tanacetum coccineum]|uniref:Uncharacterized protein n=1 Tax=Tanacetum coccineum TaxID=301880 RepID=A0ABQ4ZNM5_9ASTR
MLHLTPKVFDGLNKKCPNKGSVVTLAVPDEPSDSSSNPSLDSEEAVEDISSDEAGDTKKAGGNEQAGDTQANVHMSEPLIGKPEETLISSTQTLSFVEFTNQFLNDNPDMTVYDVLKDPVELEVQSMVGVPVTQDKLVELRPLLVDTTVTLILNTTTVSPT